jgi:alpha-tubulin suppressor-like RCC1 family protein
MNIRPPRILATLLPTIAAFGALASDAPTQSLIGWGLQEFDHAQMRGLTSISAGNFATLGVRSDGRLAGWGAYYALGGTNDLQTSALPVTDERATRDAKAVCVGSYHAVTLHNDGTLSVTGLPYPSTQRPPSDLVGVESLSVNENHSIAVLQTGAIRAFGSNSSGQCDVPADLPPVASADCGRSHSIVLLRDGAVRAWGSSLHGQTSVPIDLGPARQVAGGTYNSGALLENGTVRMWGSNAWGQASVPASVVAARQIALSRGGGLHSMALRTDGTVACWGDNSSGECNVPEGLANVVQISAGWSFSVALQSDGVVECWGWSANGQCGPASGRPIRRVVARDNNALSLLEDGTVRAWAMTKGAEVLTQRIPTGLTDVASVATGTKHCIAVRNDGTVRCWGRNVEQQCAVPADLDGVVAADGGTRVSVARRADGSLAGWGTSWRNPPEGLGAARRVACASDDSIVAIDFAGTPWVWAATATMLRTIPAGLSGLVEVAGGSAHAVAIRSDGSIACWGSNTSGQCNVPGGLTAATQVAAGNRHSIALLADGGVVAWGRNDSDAYQATVPGWVGRASFVAAMYNSSFVVCDLDDCDADGIRDAWSIMHGAWDFNENWLPDSCERTPGDMDMSGGIDFADLSLLLLDFGPCSGCPTDLDGSGTVDLSDVAMLLVNFGPNA